MNGNLDTKKSGKKKKGNSIIKRLIVFVFITGLIAGGAYSVYFFKFAAKPGKIENSALPEEILIFTFEFIPQVHTGLISLSDEIRFTEGEIKRIEGIERVFPDQIKITNSEKKIWGKNLSTLKKFLTKHETEIKRLYVSYRVNQENGLYLIKEEKEELEQNTSEIIISSKELTDKLRTIENAKSRLDKIKEKVFK